MSEEQILGINQMKCPVCCKAMVLDEKEMKCIGVHKKNTHAFYYYPNAGQFNNKYTILVVMDNKENQKVRWEANYWEYKNVSEIAIYYKGYDLVYSEDNKQYSPEEGLRLLYRMAKMSAFL